MKAFFNSYFKLLFFIVFSFSQCQQTKDVNEQKNKLFSIKDFIPLSNWHTNEYFKINNNLFINKAIYLDYKNAINGFVIPSSGQIKNGYFTFEFSIKNSSEKAQSYFYKIYYQNESYKFQEWDASDTTKENIYAGENFYGSWEDCSIQFKQTPVITNQNEYVSIKDSFRIVGNPRNETRYFENNINDRWKRNPRVGEYSFMVIVTTKENVEHKIIPDYISDISKLHSNRFYNPYFYFLYGDGKKLSNTNCIKSANTLKIIGKPDIDAGIYIDPGYYDDSNKPFFRNDCGQNDNLYQNAIFSQFVHSINPETVAGNIPVIADVLNDNYSLMDYNWNKHFYSKEELIRTTPTIAKHPCQTIINDPVKHRVIIKNPKSTYGDWKKENVGIITRHGFTYGKFTIKAKLSEILNKNGLWNGLTNAIWLITHSNDKWNIRRDCNKEGYYPNYYDVKDSPRSKNTSYSEIDFEILKTVPYCPDYQFPPVYFNSQTNQYDIFDWNKNLPDELKNNLQNIIVACTNWDMACWEPENFNAGCKTIKYKNQIFNTHRWDQWTKAISEKVYENDDELFGSDFYYFQIDWEPTEIIWRIGPSKNNMRVVGYVNHKISSIPNNQMLMIITQEFHHTKWWPGTPFDQENIPFPKNDIQGEIYELTIE